MDSEKPIHEVTVPDFYMGQYPVTFEEYDAFCEATGKEKPGDQGWGRGKRPVINVNWQDAKDYCQWLSEQTNLPYRLPSEAEWEYAARGGEKGISDAYEYAGSNDLDEVGWYNKNSSRKTQLVGQKKPNQLGLYDMSGNVWEWCEDVWHANYKGAPDNGSAWIKGGEQNRRVVRGGSWILNNINCRCAYRYRYDDDFSRSSSLGFRLSRY
jgi:formylglycine-generating enzyme required for sulfatase activity